MSKRVANLSSRLTGDGTNDLGLKLLNTEFFADRRNLSSSSMSGGYRVADLPMEVLYEIFFRLPALKLVFKFRCVSKLWNRLLSNPSFVNKMYNSLTSIPWIFMYDPSSEEQCQLYPNDSHNFINHHDGLSLTFLLDTDPFKTQKKEVVCVLGSCSNGLVLYSTEKTVEFPAEQNTSYYYICNPLTKQWVSLPPRPPDNGSKRFLMCFQLVCDTSTVSVSHSICNYMVVRIVSDHKDSNFNLQIFSSDTGKWKTSEVSRPINQRWKSFSNMVVRRGVLYWMAEESLTSEKFLIAYSLETLENGSDQCRSIGYPKLRRGFIDFLGESQGSIYCGGVAVDPQDLTGLKVFLSVWLLEDDCTNGGLHWKMVHESVELKGYRSSGVDAMYINPVDRNVFIIVDWGCCLAYNITTLTHEVLHGCPIPTDIEQQQSRPILIIPKPTVIPSINW